MMRAFGPWILAILCVASIAGKAPAQKEEKYPPPVAVEGTPMIMTEYGVEFPKEITWPKDGSVMVLVPHGTFKMGLDEADGGKPDERPAHEVTLPSFYIDKYEVSNAQYTRFLLESDSSAARQRPSLSDKLMADNAPVCAIDWRSAQKYAEWAGKQLPTEAMWERAARGPENTLYTTGNTVPAASVLVVGKGSEGLTVPVDKDTGDVSGYGVFHLGGNVSEWVHDYYARDYYSVSEAENPQGPSKGESRVVRGGNFFVSIDTPSAVTRNSNPPTHIRDHMGFRTAWVPKAPVDSGDGPTPTPAPSPTPSREDVVKELMNKLLPHLQANDPKLPRDMMAGRVYTSQGWNALQFINFTPYDVRLSFVGPNEELVYKYNEPLPKMSYRNVSLPRGRDLCIVAYAPDAPRTGPFTMGCLRAESFAIIVMKADLLTPYVMQDGSKVPMKEDTMPEYYYGDYNPLWNEIEIQNTLDEPVVLNLDDTTVSRENPQHIDEYTLEGGEIRQMTLRPGRYRFKVDYIGAMDASCEPEELMIDDSTARRLLVIKQDTSRPDGVTVIAKKRPFLMFDPVQAKVIGFPRGQVTKEEK